MLEFGPDITFWEFPRKISRKSLEKSKSKTKLTLIGFYRIVVILVVYNQT
jgi:hypothetical protein